MKQYLVGIDIGTTGCKTGVFDLNGNLISLDYREYPCHYPAPGLVEQHSDEITPKIFESCKAAIQEAGIDADAILAVALAPQGATIGMTDKNNHLLHNFISWQDLRGFTMMDEFASKITAPELYAITGGPLSPINPLSKLIWLQKFEPEKFNQADHFVTMQEFFLREFGAEENITDESSCGREGLAEVDMHRYSRKIFEIFNFDLSKRARVVPGGTPICNIPPQIAEKTGLSTRTLLCVGGLDQNASHFGAGIIREGDACVVLGTFGACYVVSDKPVREPHGALTVKSNTGMSNWTLEGMSFACASSFKWLRDTFGELEKAAQGLTGVDAYDLITRQIAQSQPGANGITFLNHLQGAANARANMAAKGVFAGMTLATTRADMLRAVMEGICYEMKEIINLEENCGVKVTNIRLAGGATRSSLWNQMQADIYQAPVIVTDCSETGCLGAAMYAGMAAGVYKDAQDAVNKCVHFKAQYSPNLDLVDKYMAGFEQFGKLYDALNGRYF